MSKFRKFFTSPSLYWRDFLLKRYPLPKHTALSPEHISADNEREAWIAFAKRLSGYYVSGHGTGVMSFTYYLRKIGIAPIWRMHLKIDPALTYRDRPYLITPQMIPRLLSYYDHIWLGVSKFHPKIDSLFTQSIPAYVVVRDPVENAISAINRDVLQQVIQSIHGVNHANKMFLGPDDICRSLYGLIHPEWFGIRSMLSPLPNLSQVKIIDTNDITGTATAETMLDIVKDGKVGQDQYEKYKNIFLGKSGDAVGRIMRNYFYGLRLILRDSSIVEIRIAPSHFGDFVKCAYFCPDSAPSHTLFDVEIDGMIYDVVLTRFISAKNNPSACDLDSISSELQEKENISRIVIYAKSVVALSNTALNVYKNVAINRDRFIDSVRNNKNLYDKFNRYIDEELIFIVEKYRPNLVNTWSCLTEFRAI